MGCVHLVVAVWLGGSRGGAGVERDGAEGLGVGEHRVGDGVGGVAGEGLMMRVLGVAVWD